jgi:hypothetical protein
MKIILTIIEGLWCLVYLMGEGVPVQILAQDPL